MKRTWKQIISCVIVAVMLFGMMPIDTGAATTKNPMTVTLRSEDGTVITGANITATVTSGWNTVTLTVTENGNGRYTVYRDNYNKRNNTINFTVNASGYETATHSVRGNTSSTTITMTPIVVREQWQKFKLYYYLNGNEEDPYPKNYAASGDAGNYGPSRDNTPFATVNVNIAALKSNYPDAVVYVENSSEGNQYQFTPVESSDRKAAVEAFWQAVQECMDEESIAALEATGIYDWFSCYVLKKQKSGSFHGDGVLEVKPPVYSIELYKDATVTGGTDSYVGGLLTNSGEEFKTVDDVLTALEGYLGYTITWTEDANGKPVANDEGVYIGTFVHEKHLHTITVIQANATAASPVEGSEIPYEKISDYYYLARYELEVEEEHQVEFIIRYTDGDANDTAFYEHSYGVSHTGNAFPKVPAFTGLAVREGYTFLGWILEGGDGTIYSDAQVQAVTVTSDMVFHAEWEPIPLTYIGSVHVLLNGSYNAENHTATGTPIDIQAVTGSLVQLYLKEQNSTEYIPLVAREGAVGIYEAVLENGSYTIHYSLDGGATIKPTDEQLLTIDDADRSRYLFFNSVEYDLNGGQSAEDFPAEYYQAGMKDVRVTDQIPTRDRYIFSHWEDQDGNRFDPGQVLTAEISKPHVLTAQWKDAMDVYVVVEIKHEAENGEGQNNDNGMHDIFFTLDSRTGAGDYTEIYSKQIEWDGESDFNDPIFQLVGMDGGIEQTLYKSYVPVLENVDAAAEYTFTTTKPGYTLKPVQQEYNENGDLIIEALLIFDPNNFDFTFDVRLDEEAKQLPAQFKPVAANVKVTFWGDTPNDEDYGLPEGDQTLDWYTITQQRYTYERIVLDENGEGTGSFPVWMTTTDVDTVMTWHYRIEVVSYEMPNGEINPASDVDQPHVKYLSDCGHIEANIVVTDGKSPDDLKTELAGAYYLCDEDHKDGQQVGHVEAIISVHTYSVTFDPNGGVLNGTEEDTVVEPLFQIPNLEDYIPTREGGYVFAGWYLADENGQMTETAAESFTPLHSDVTLIAKWKEPLTITANVAIDASYQTVGSDGSVTIHTIHEKARADHATVTLQKILKNGYPETVSVQTVPVSYDGAIGTGTVSFTQVPDDGHDYRVLVMTHNYTFTYQNEPESLDENKKTDYAGSYNATDYIAAYGEDSVGVINAYGSFTPDNFQLEYEVDAKAIGDGFRPDGAVILITHDNDEGVRDPSLWPVICQMEYGDEVVGQETVLTDGFGSNSYTVWRSYPDGRTAEYALRVESTLSSNVLTAFDPETAPFHVEYQVPAYFVDPDGQSQLLVASLIPNVYHITYELDGGTIYGSHPHSHTWSFDTDISKVVPVKNGYVFDGWFLDEALTQPAGDCVDAAVHGAVTLYAKWTLALDVVNLTVVIDHVQGNDPESSAGQAAAYERILHTQLTSHPDGGDSASYAPVDGTEMDFDSSYWHTELHGTPVEEFSIFGLYMHLPSDMAYSALASMEGYQIVPEECSVTPSYDEENENGTTYDVVVYLKYHPELFTLDYTVRMDETVDQAYDPAAAQVRITAWYNEVNTDYDLNWYEITQHKQSYMTVPLDDTTRSGSGSYQVWCWYLKEKGIPFYYRIEVIGLVLDDGTVVNMQPEQAHVSYTGGVYTATVSAENGAVTPIPQTEGFTTDLTGVYYDGYAQAGTLEAVITVHEPAKVIFHSNNDQALEGDVFRTYYPAGAVLTEDNQFHLTGTGTVEAFYEIPSFRYETHNGYIFKGWYDGPGEDAVAVNWDTVYTKDAHVYAHWIEVGEVAKEDDGKIYADIYSEYDLMGTQIRTTVQNSGNHYGEAGAGLRFITSLSERVYQQMNTIHENNSAGIEYGFVVAKTSAVEAKATGEDYRLKYKHDSINGEDTSSDYSYVINTPCRVPDKPVDDHFAGERYRLYTAVITYKNLTGDKLISAQNTNFIARSYLRYFDANGLERIHYNNYTGESAAYGGVNTCYAAVYDILNGQ